MTSHEPWDADPIDSSDFEFEPPVTTKAVNLGRASLEKIIQAAAEDRYTTKKTAKQLEYGSGAPGSRALQQLWSVRFETFRKHTLQKSAGSTPSGDEILRFFDGIIEKIGKTKDKPAPSLKTMVRAFVILINYSTFTYQDFKLPARDGARIKTFFDDCVRNGRLIKGLWEARVWISFTILARMTSETLQHYIQNGTGNWDTIVARVLSVVLTASMGARAGDVARTALWKGKEYLQWQHIELVLDENDGGRPSFLDLRAHITLESTKGYKDTKNHSVEKYMRPLEDEKYRHVCPVTWLLIHALRHGLVRGTSIEQVLSDAAARNDRKVVWIHPEWPVCAGFNRLEASQIHLDRPAGAKQLLTSIKRMGLISNILTRVYIHATRGGHAQGVSQLPVSEQGHGYVTSQVRQSLGHSERTFQGGTTELYTGNPTREVYNEIAKNEHVSKYGAKFSQTSALQIVKAPVTNEEIAEYQRQHEPDTEEPRSKLAMERARRNIRRQRHQVFLKAAEPEKVKGKGTALTQRSASENNILPGPGKSDRRIPDLPDPVNLITTYVNILRDLSKESRWAELNDRILCQLCERKPQEPWITGCLHLYCKECLGNLTCEASDLNLDETSCRECKAVFTESQRLEGPKESEFRDLVASVNIDPRLLGEGESTESHVEQGDLDTLSSTVLLTQEAQEDGMEDAALESLFLDHQVTDASTFITKYSRINITIHSLFAVTWNQCQAGKIERIEGMVPRGNSRDEPTPFEYCCTKIQGCPFHSNILSNLLDHEKSCTSERVERREKKLVPCTSANCQSTFIDKKQMLSHVACVHDWKPRPCPLDDCPDQPKMYTTRDSYSNHMKKHDSRYPTACFFPGCPDEKLWPNSKQLSRHLTKDHGLTTTEERKPYHPASTARKGRKRAPADTQEQEPESSKSKKSKV